MNDRPQPSLPPNLHIAGTQRTQYHFPVYRFINWITVGAYLVGLVIMYFLLGMFGIPAPLGWAAIVIILSVGILLLGKPKLLLNCMLFYFLLMPGNRLLGLLPLPLPNFLDELFFVPLVAVIVMYHINGHIRHGGLWFPTLFVLITGLSWYVNGKPSSYALLKVTLVNLKFFIIWYYCRLTATFEDDREAMRWTWLYVGYAAIQFAYNCLWQRGPWPTRHPDFSFGVFGFPGAHMVGYMSVLALFLLFGIYLADEKRFSRRGKFGLLLLAAVLLHNLVFMTDTKHALVIAPACCGILFLLPRVSVRMRLSAILLALAMGVAGFSYFQMKGGMDWARSWVRNGFQNSARSAVLQAITRDFPYIVRYPVLGAGPGQFTSQSAQDNKRPLARRYILPYTAEERRRSYFGLQGTTSTASVIGSSAVDTFYIIGELGYAGELLFNAFFLWIGWVLLRRGTDERNKTRTWGIRLMLGIGIAFLMILRLLANVSTVPALFYPIWILIGRLWDMPPPGAKALPADADEEEALLPADADGGGRDFEDVG